MSNVIIYTLPNILIAYVYCLIYKKYSNSDKVFGTIDYIMMVVVSILLSINSLNQYALLKVAISYILTLLLLKTIFKDKIIDMLFTYTFIFLSSVVVDLFCSIIAALVTNNSSELMGYQYFKYYYSILYAMIFFGLLNNRFFARMINKITTELNVKSKYIISFIISFLIFVSILYFFYTMNYLDFKYYISICLTVLFMIILCFLITENLFKNRTLEIRNKYFQTSINNYAKTIEDYRLLKHNLINDLLLIKCNKDKDSIIEQTIKKYNKSYDWINNCNNIPAGIQGLLYIKMQYANQNNIQIYLENNVNIDMENLKQNKYYNLCEIIQILLDNAIEAAIETKEKQVFIAFYDNKDFFYVDIINKFTNVIDVDRIGNLSYSTKERNSGFGLNYIARLNKEIKVKKKIVNDIFINTIEIKK